MPVGFCLGWYRGLRSFVDPVINFFRALPPIALIPLVIVYFGIGEAAKTMILFYASFFAGVIVMYEGIAQISPIYVRVARTLGANDFEIFAKVIVPLTVPHILTAIRVALGVAWATLVASELIAAQEGLGALNQRPGSIDRWDGPYLKTQIPQDPWNRPFFYRSPGEGGRPYDLYSLGADGQPGGDGPNRDVTSTDASG